MGFFIEMKKIMLGVRSSYEESRDHGCLMGGGGGQEEKKKRGGKKRVEFERWRCSRL